jgi:hypothetical protein
MRSGKICVAGISLLVIGACAADGRVHGNAALGVAQFQASSSAERLDVQGLGEDGQVIAAVHLGIRLVTDGDHGGIGRSLTVELSGEAGRTFESIGLEPIHLAPPADARIEALLLDPYVAELLAGRGIVMGPAPAKADPPETEYGHGGSCTIGADSWLPQCMNTVFTACCMTHLNGSGYQAQSVACGNASPKVEADRACFSVPTCTSGKAYGPVPVGCDTLGAIVCPVGTTAFLSTTSGKFQCQVNSGAPNQCPSKAIGPLGCATCWTAAYTGGMRINYSSATDTCTYLNTFNLTVTTQIMDGEGRVTSSPAGIDAESPQTVVAAFASGQVVTLTADPLGSGVRAVFSGACAGTGAVGQNRSCNVTMSADQSVNVKFECASTLPCPQ